MQQCCKCGVVLWNLPYQITKWGQFKDSKWSRHKIETFWGAKKVVLNSFLRPFFGFWSFIHPLPPTPYFSLTRYCICDCKCEDGGGGEGLYGRKAYEKCWKELKEFKELNPEIKFEEGPPWRGIELVPVPAPVPVQARIESIIRPWLLCLLWMEPLWISKL